MEHSRSDPVSWTIIALLMLLIVGCTGEASTAQTSLPEELRLSIVSPVESLNIRGGGDLRIALSLVDGNDNPVEGASVQVELRHSDGELYADFLCEHNGHGSYMTEMIHLPMRSSSGTWRIAARAAHPGGAQAEAEGSFQAKPSISEIYLERYGFWAEYPHIFGLGTGFYGLHAEGGLHFEDWLNPDGSGYVILDNYRYGTTGVTFATLEIHWQARDFPAEQAAAIAVAEDLASAGLHHQEADVPLGELSAEVSEFQGRPAWRVAGQGSELYVSVSGAEYPVEWMIFECPDSNWLWSLVIAADEADYLEHLRSVRNTFECPLGDPN